LPAHFFRQSSATLIIAQHAEAFGKARRHAIPRIECAAELVQQHDRAPAIAGERVMQAHAIGVDEVFGG
jgi:hypothetical protein